MYTVLDENLQVKGRLSLNNGQGNTTFFSDTITTQMATDNANDPAGLTTVDYTNQDKQGNAKQWSHSLTVSVEATDLGTSINTTDYLMYFDSVADHYYLMKVINTSTDRNSGFITVSAINAAIFELGKQLIQTEKTLAQIDLKTFVSKMYKNAPFSLRVADDNLTVIDYVVSANTSLQALLQDLQTKFNVDVDSWVELDTTGHIVDRVLYFGHLGSDNGELIRYGGAKGFENMTATEVSDIIYTKLYVTGKTDDKDAKKGHIGSVNNGMEYIVDDDANQRVYAIGASQQQPVYLEGTITNSLLSEPKALVEWAKQQIDIFNHPRFNYTVSPLHDQIVALGDTVTVQDFHIKPEILVTSKVIQKTVSFASPETNTFVLGEFSSIFTDNMNKSANVINLIKKDVTVVQAAADIAKAQADAAYQQAVTAQEKAIHAQTSADGKTTTYTVDSVQDLPQSANEGDIGWVKLSDGTHMYSYTDGKWVEKINPSMGADIDKKVSDVVIQAKDYSDKAIADNQVKIDESIKSVDDKTNKLKQDQSALDTKAQGYANQAKADAIANTTQAVKETLDNSQKALDQAKTDLTNGIAKETADRQSAVNALDTKAQGYANQAKSDAISAATTADGVINKKIDDTASSITTTIRQNKTDANGKIATAQSMAQQAVDGLTLKVSKTDYDQKTGDLSTKINDVKETADKSAQTIADIQEADGKQDARMSEIENTASGLKSTVSDLSTEQGKQSGYISTLQQRADGFDATVTKVNNLSVGGRNLLLGTATPWTVKANDNTYNFDSMYDHLKGGTTYTFSAEISVSNGQDSVSVGAFDAQIVTAWAFSYNFSKGVKRGSFTFTTPDNIDNDGHLIIYAGTQAQTAGLSATYTHMKLEEGTIPTDWSPAPEDVDSATAKAQLTADQATLSINNYKTDADGRISKAQADIITNANAITQKVSQTDYNAKTGDLSTKVSTAQQTADQANTTIGNYQKSNDGRVTSAESAIKQNADGLELTATKQELSDTDAKTNYRVYQTEQNVSQLKIDTTGISSTVSKLSDDTDSKFSQQQQTIDSINSTVQQQGTNINKVSTRVQTAEGNISTVQNNITGLQSSQKQTADGLSQEVSDRKSGDSTVFQQGKDFTTSQVSNSESNMRSLINQKADSTTIGVIQNDVATLKSNTQWQRIERFDDMNSMTQSGRFFIGASNNTNSAVTASLYMMVDAPQADRITQTQWKDLDGSLMYRRTYNGSSWTPWTQMVMSSTLLNIFHDSWSLGTTTNDGITKQMVTGIMGQPDGTLILKGNSLILDENTTVTGDFYAKGGNFQNLNASNIKVGTLDGYQVNIANVNVNNLVGDTISGFNFNVNKQMTIASGGIIKSDVINMGSDSFDVNSSNIDSTRTSSESFKVATFRGTFKISSGRGSVSSSGDISVYNDGQSQPYKNGHYGSEYNGNNILLYALGYDNGDPNEFLNMSSAQIDISYSSDGLLSNAGDKTKIRSNLIETTGTLNAFSGTQTPNVYSYPNLNLESKNKSVVLIAGGKNILQARENGYLYLLNRHTGSGGVSVQMATDGALFMQSSATKYKEDIQYDGGTSVGDKFLTLDPATWQDKDEYEQRKLYRETGTEPTHQIHMTDKRYYGLIAEDLVKAGLEEFVVRDEVTGEVNGLEYDKVAISLIPVVREQRDAINELRLEVERLKQK
ncbi:hypothetical protein EFN57_04625 [Leuconostoc citreum]|uniref:hypothetical protein n=1 Tax=Leuconostoc citreum TaxID=33964 RepID=UPI0021A71369|nr:hypothetical protein [Leuconostoc citreum]MCT3055746.1 hypothetical protein [Leuconostoc citreum]MCT3062269.1 hypothetical protein [Leuconostoc citreum]